MSNIQYQINRFRSANIVGTNDYGLESIHSADQKTYGTLDPPACSGTWQPSTVAPADIYWLQPGWTGIVRDLSEGVFWGEMPSPFPSYRLKAMLVRYDVMSALSDEIPFTFNGLQEGVVQPHQVLYADPLQCFIPKGERYYIRFVINFPTNGILPPAATVTAGLANSGNMASGSYYLATTWVFPRGLESAAMEATGSTYPVSVTANGSISVTPLPNPQNGAVGYRIYISQSGAAASAYKYEAEGVGVQPFSSASAPVITNSPDLTYNTRRVAVTNALPNQQYQYGVGSLLNGAGGQGGSNTGEWANPTADVFGPNYFQPGSNAGVGTPGGPIIVLGGFAPDAGVPSFAILGDSRADGVGDLGFGFGNGGYPARALGNQFASVIYSAVGPIPSASWVHLASPGEMASVFATPYYSSLRRDLAARASNFICNYSINDLKSTINDGSATLVSNLLTIAKWLVGQAKTDQATPIPTWIQSTIEPYVLSSDAFQSVANQVLAWDGHTGIAYTEGFRRQMNNLLRCTTNVSFRLVGEKPFACKAYAYNSASYVNSKSNPYSGGDGSASAFITNYPVLYDSEVVYVGSQVYNRFQSGALGYTYTDQASINGVTYASGVILNQAPSSGSGVTVTYSAPAGYTTLFGSATGSPFIHIADVAYAIEVNATGGYLTWPTTGGIGVCTNCGFWRPNNPTPLATGLVSTVTSSGQLVASGTTGWGVDQWRGYLVAATNAATVPNAMILSNNSTTLSLLSLGGFPVTDTLGAPEVLLSQNTVNANNSFSIFQGYNCGDGVHPSPSGHMAEAAVVAGLIKYAQACT